MKHAIWMLWSLVVLFTGCTTLGPMPATTGVSAAPAGRPGLEVQAGGIPAYYLSAAAGENTTSGEPVQQLSGLIEPGRWLGVPGLIAGLRSYGEGGDRTFEPMLGYRHRFAEQGAVAAIAYGTRANGRSNDARYEATRVGGELAIDGTLFTSRWVSLHLQAAGAATYLSATGSYCTNTEGYGTDCQGDATDHRVDSEIEGLYTSATGSIVLGVMDGRPAGIFHGARFAFLTSVGHMPRLREGQQIDGTGYVSVGLSLTLGFGAER
ncbi:MAG: hypothetical protein ACTHU0_21380 [Kofleriaceae bacterium]